MNQVIGWSMLVVLFGGLFAFICAEEGSVPALVIYGIVAGLCCFVAIACHLIAS